MFVSSTTRQAAVSPQGRSVQLVHDRGSERRATRYTPDAELWRGRCMVRTCKDGRPACADGLYLGAAAEVQHRACCDELRILPVVIIYNSNRSTLAQCTTAFGLMTQRR